MAWLMPITAGGSPVAPWSWGRGDQQPYGDEDLMLLDDVADQLAAVIRMAPAPGAERPHHRRHGVRV